MEEVDKALAKIINEIAPEAVPKLIKAIGFTLDTLNGILAIPKFLACDSVKYVMKKLNRGLESIPEDEIIPILPEIGGEILQRLPIISSNELRDLYAELLIKASTKSGIEKVHPRFIQLLKSLSADEVLIIKFLIKNPSYAFPNVTPCFPIIKESKKKYGEGLIWTPPELNNTLAHPSNLYIYFINLSKLGILDEQKNKYLEENEEMYKSIENIIKDRFEQGEYDLYKGDCSVENIIFERGYYKTNEFGVIFLESLS